MKYKIFETREAFRFGFWGVVTTLYNYFSFFFLKQIMAYQIANLISIISTKILVYYTNKKFVFQTKTSWKGQVLEVFRYVLGRGLTGVVDFVGLIVLVDVFGVDDRIGKMLMIVIIMPLNYILGRVFVFQKKDGISENEESV
ncbi:MAG: GtrA family protein [Lachnospiraceae bacterium]|nr:GtrA family protein [Lachnospiraceae bacterium]